MSEIGARKEFMKMIFMIFDEIQEVKTGESKNIFSMVGGEHQPQKENNTKVFCPGVFLECK